MNWRFRTLCRIQTPLTKRLISLVNIAHKHAGERAKYTIPCMARKLQFSPVADQIDDSVGEAVFFVSRPFELEIENFGVEM